MDIIISEKVKFILLRIFCLNGIISFGGAEVIWLFIKGICKIYDASIATTVGMHPQVWIKSGLKSLQIDKK